MTGGQRGDEDEEERGERGWNKEVTEEMENGREGKV